MDDRLRAALEFDVEFWCCTESALAARATFGGGVQQPKQLSQLQKRLQLQAAAAATAATAAATATRPLCSLAHREVVKEQAAARRGYQAQWRAGSSSSDSGKRQLWSRPLRKGSLADAHKAEAAAAKKVNRHDVTTRIEVRCTANPGSTFPGDEPKEMHLATFT